MLSCRVGLITFLIVTHELVQMCSVDIFASGLMEESDDWENICQKAYTLDKADFLESGYPITSAMVPSSFNKRKLRSNQESPRKTVPNSRLTDSHKFSIDDDIEEAEDEQDEVQSEEDMENVGMETLVKQSLELRGSSASSMLQPLFQTPGSLLPSVQPQKKKKKDTITSVVKQMAELQRQTAEAMETMRRITKASQRQTEVALAQMRASVADERQANAQMHKTSIEWMRAESNKSHELMQMLMNRIGIEPIAQLPPATQSPPLRLEGQPSSSNMSMAFIPLQPANVSPPLPTKEAAPIPLPPHEGGQIAMDEEDASVEVMDIGSKPIVVGHNLAMDASEAGLGNTSLPVDDPTSGCAL